MKPDEPVSNDDLIEVEPWWIPYDYTGHHPCTGCHRALEPNEKYVYLPQQAMRLCRWCVAKIHQVSSKPDV